MHISWFIRLFIRAKLDQFCQVLWLLIPFAVVGAGFPFCARREVSPDRRAAKVLQNLSARHFELMAFVVWDRRLRRTP